MSFFGFKLYFLNLINTNTSLKKLQFAKKKYEVCTASVFSSVSLFDDEAKCEAFDMKIIFHYHASKTRFL